MEMRQPEALGWLSVPDTVLSTFQIVTLIFFVKVYEVGNLFLLILQTGLVRFGKVP